MNAPKPSGYDAAQARREEDDLDRWRFAAEIVEVILATPIEWSARIGIFGKWGEGKSTVLRFAEQMLGSSGNVVFWFSPWAIQGWNDLWEEFGSSLLEALSAANIPFEGGWRQKAKQSSEWIASKGLDQVAEAGASLLGREKLYNVAFGALSRWLKYDGEQIKTIREKLGNRRVVVLIDDLDRSTPDLLPRLLLSLREVLDLPGFTFVLAFDDEIVGRALTGTNPAWVGGADFLEKILDFRFYLPTITVAQKGRFVSRAMSKYCPFVPSASTKDVQDLLPNNPRKLKGLVRSLASLQPQVARHDPDELSWTDMWLAQMIRLESYSFMDRLLLGDTLDKEVVSYRLFARTNKEGEKNKTLKEVIAESGVHSPSGVERLIQLTEAVRSRSSGKFRYACELAIRPHTVTWKEFRSLKSIWAADQRPAVIADWIKRHANERSADIGDVETEVFQAMYVERQSRLAAAADSASIEEHDANIKEAGNLLEMIEQYLLGLGKLGPSEFRELYGQVSYWIGFRKNPSDKAMRDAEKGLLLKLLSSASGPLSSQLFEIVYPENPYPDFGEGEAEKQALRAECRDLIAPNAAEEAIAFISRKGGVQSLTEPGRFAGVKYCLFGQDSAVWKDPLRDKLFGFIRRGRQDFEVYQNVYLYFQILMQGLERGLELIDKPNIEAVLSDKGFVECLWSTITSRSIQYRMQVAFLRARQSFIQIGIPETVLPLTDELKARSEEEDARSRQKSKPSSDVPNLA